MNKKITRHTIYVNWTDDNDFIFGNYQEVKNKALEKISGLEDNTKINFLWYKQSYTYSEIAKNYIGDGYIFNISSHCCSDKSNWLTVKEIKHILGFMKIDGSFSDNETFVPEEKESEERTVLEELKDD